MGWIEHKLIAISTTSPAMATDLLSLLPTPKNVFNKKPARESAPIPIAAKVVSVPDYGQRSSFLPRNNEDFGDGGAFPEIHIMQYPLDMGTRKNTQVAARTASLQVDGEGNVRYDMILRQNMRKDVTIYSSYNDLIERDLPDEALVKPSLEVSSPSPSPVPASRSLLFTSLSSYHYGDIGRTKNSGAYTSSISSKDSSEIGSGSTKKRSC
jgi:SNW domain-containing protein 1